MIRLAVPAALLVSVFWDVNADAAGANSSLKLQGPVEIVRACDEVAKAAPLARSGDGYTADLAGGFLVAGQGAHGELNLASDAPSIWQDSRLESE